MGYTLFCFCFWIMMMIFFFFVDLSKLLLLKEIAALTWEHTPWLCDRGAR